MKSAVRSLVLLISLAVGGAAFAAGEALLIRAVLAYRDASGLAAYDCSILAGGAEVASATLKIFEPDDFQTFQQASPR